MIQSRLDLGGFKPPQITSPARVSDADVCPHRLGAQDEALSRLKLEFEISMGTSRLTAFVKGGFVFKQVLHLMT